MYCSNCGTAITPGLTFCNPLRSQAGRKIRTKQNARYCSFPLTAITLICYLWIGNHVGRCSLVLKKEAGLPEDLVGFFMLFTFISVVLTEITAHQNSVQVDGVRRSETSDHSSLNSLRLNCVHHRHNLLANQSAALLTIQLARLSMYGANTDLD